VAYADVCVQSVEAPGINGSGLANVSGGGANGSAAWVAEVREHCYMCMLTYADLWTYADACSRILTYADVC
jgi:hypothetical protein